MQKTVIDCLQQVWFVERGNARATDECTTIRQQDMGGIIIVEGIHVPAIGPAQGVPALQLNEYLVAQVVILLQQRKIRLA